MIDLVRSPYHLFLISFFVGLLVEKFCLRKQKWPPRNAVYTALCLAVIDFFPPETAEKKILGSLLTYQQEMAFERKG